MLQSSQRQVYLFVLPWSIVHVGGVNQVVVNLAKEMLRRDTYEPIILILDWEAVDPIWEIIHGLKTVRWRIRPFNFGIGIKETVAYSLWELRFRPVFKAFCVKNAVSVVNVHYANSVAFTLQRLMDGYEATLALIISFHGADLTAISNGQEFVISKWKQLLSRTRAVVSCSNDLGRRLVNTFGAQIPLDIIHNGLDSEAFVASAISTVQSVTGRMILNVGKFEKKKGQDVLISAFATIAGAYEDLCLTLVGASDDQLPKLRELCVTYGIENRVHFFFDVPHSQIAAFFKRAAIFALPSRQEPFGIVLLEAGSFCLPVVATNVGGIPEIVTHGVTGYLVSPESADELARALRSLLDNPDVATSMAKQLNKEITTKFTWEIAHEKYLRIADNNNVKKRGAL